MNSAYAAFVAAAAAVALLERLYALRNERRMRSAGAAEIAPWVFLWMVPVYALHFPAALLEHVLLHRRPPAALVVSMTALFVASKLLKAWAVRHLDGGWTMRVLVTPSGAIASGGPYRYIRHPNYVAVVGEMLSLTLLGGAWLTAMVFGGAFLLILRARVRTEESALLALPEYAARMADRARFLPGSGR